MWLKLRPLIFGVLLALPFFVANALVAMQSKWFLYLLRPMGETTGYEQVFVLALMAFVLIGGLVALFPVLKDRKLYIVNVLIGIALVVFAVLAGHGLVLDFYHCDVLRIPNCD